MTSSDPTGPVSRIRWRRGQVSHTGRSWRDALELTVEVPGDGKVRALAYPSLVGTPEIGDDVLLNTTAGAQNLRTGAMRWWSRSPTGCPRTRPARGTWSRRGTRRSR